jgi:hypothetical protein
MGYEAGRKPALDRVDLDQQRGSIMVEIIVRQQPLPPLSTVSLSATSTKKRQWD